ncbi:hypothetical protein LuPra_05137 [Luteitalea pratensis]|uniref:Zinc-finger domain-containing protein n=1 Tax=Luteitalea pratensis TaxID=1855912 RepID=A0A143PUX5_LUTPR|nr:hypothetical protein LuPra_05137 [Luteitalea pratensis]
MECQDATADIAEYLAGSLPVEKLEALLCHAVACAACRDKVTETWRQLGRIRLPAVIALVRACFYSRAANGKLLVGTFDQTGVSRWLCVLARGTWMRWRASIPCTQLLAVF